MKWFRLLDKYLEPTLIVIAISTMTTLLCLQIALRLFDATIAWAEELARYLFVWAMYLSISYCIRDDRHIRIRVFIDKLPGNWTQFSLIASDLIYLAFSATVAWFGFKVINRSLQLGQIAPAMEIPIACLYASVLVCAILSCVRLVTSIYQRTSALSNTSERIRFSRQRYRHLKAKYRTSNRLLELNA
ncbi:TRAP transporter small permease [Vibrio sp. zbq_19]|uniref:TRAP transporter small permease n=1 Tax=unclassified Vibrio TaxID=2614977 RepID=UPI0021D34F0B|nr:TRAP transporter small permease [Vibrio sp. Vb1755]EJE3286961.1 TRAP transporter small permease [Vibrio alginolyticus]EJN3358508.1 TRAP transporter small permease [Vibrio alginolyticus]EJS0371094.1 TRAP transporter small permease [Vibrio alginolyticus]ELA7387316.1 TRAP transporter small permease [Vibrio alginolyticus]MDW1829682.1 TRAP transporter small permease [Vibrio sp. Vb1755]